MAILDANSDIRGKDKEEGNDPILLLAMVASVSQHSSITVFFLLYMLSELLVDINVHLVNKGSIPAFIVS